MPCYAMLLTCNECSLLLATNRYEGRALCPLCYTDALHGHRIGEPCEACTVEGMLRNGALLLGSLLPELRTGSLRALVGLLEAYDECNSMRNALKVLTEPQLLQLDSEVCKALHESNTVQECNGALLEWLHDTLHNGYYCIECQGD